MTYATVLLAMLTCWGVCRLCYATEGKTVFMPIEDANHKTPIAIGARGIYGLLQRGNLFIDTSLIIMDLLEYRNVKLIARPKGWGKTVNMDLIKKFFEVVVHPNGELMDRETTHNFRLFYHGIFKTREGNVTQLPRLLYIAYEAELLAHYMGKHPVVHMDFESLKPKNFDQFVRLLHLAVGEAFRKHRYILNKLDMLIKYSYTKEPDRDRARKEYALFDKMMKGKGSREELLNGTVFLCEMLEKFTTMKPIILMDEYDYPLNYILFRDNVESLIINQTVEFFKTFLNRMFVPSKHYETAVMAGTFMLITGLEFKMDVLQFDSINDERFGYYFGFSSYDMNMIFNHLNFPENERQEVIRHFGGYHGGPRSMLNLTRPASIAKYLKERKIEVNYDEFDWIDGYLFRRIPMEYLQQELHFVATGNSFSIRRNQRFLPKDFVHIGRLLTYDMETRGKEIESTIQTIMDMLFALGYLTPETNTTEPIQFITKVPNEQTRLIIRRKLMYYYATELGFRTEEGSVWMSLYQLTQELHEFAYNKDNTSSQLILMFESFFNLLHPFNPSPKRGAVRIALTDFIMRSALNYITLFMDKFRYFPTETSCVYNTTNLFAATFLIGENKHGLLLQLTRGENDTNVAMSDVLGLNYARVVKTLKVIGVNIKLDRTVQLTARTSVLKPSGCNSTELQP